MRNQVFFNEAMRQCLKSSYKQRVGAIVRQGNSIVGKGFNKVHGLATAIPGIDGLHAEVQALHGTTAGLREGSTVYVCRMNRQGVLLFSKPCSYCENIMRKMGVKNVVYSVYGSWEKMNL